MKIDMMESLGCSFLRHVQHCWIVQTNWKWPSAAFDGVTPDLEEEFAKIREQFSKDGIDVFKKTRNLEQLLKHAELDALGVTRGGEVHALEAAFHEEGLRYGKTVQDTVDRVSRKMLRTYLVLRGLGYSDPGHRHIWFISPKVRGKRAEGLRNLFDELKRTIATVHWHLCIDEAVNTEVLQTTLDCTKSQSDTAELLLRAEKLLKAAHA